MLRFVKNIINPIFSLAFPDLCPACHDEHPVADEDFCYPCLQTIPFFKSQKDVRVLMKAKKILPSEIINEYALMSFTKLGKSQELLHEIKYYNNNRLAVKLGRLLGHNMPHNPNAILVPVPLHPKRLSERGFNQARKIAEGIKEIRKEYHIDEPLVRERYEKSQTQKSRTERQQILEQTFVLKSGMNRNYEGKDLILVDDVVTTGATVAACYSKLKMLEYKTFSLATIALAI